MNVLLLTLILSLFATAGTVPLGTYSLATESEWGTAFELQPKGKALVTTKFNYYYDDTGKRHEEKKVVKGSWQYKRPFLILKFDKFEDCFKECHSSFGKEPCFKYDHSLKKDLESSPLRLDFEYLNWSAAKK